MRVVAGSWRQKEIVIRDVCILVMLPGGMPPVLFLDLQRAYPGVFFFFTVYSLNCTEYYNITQLF